MVSNQGQRAQLNSGIGPEQNCSKSSQRHLILLNYLIINPFKEIVVNVLQIEVQLMGGE